MNNVPSLQGNSSIILTPAGHGLGSMDGAVLLQILNDLYSPEQQPAEDLVAAGTRT